MTIPPRLCKRIERVVTPFRHKNNSKLLSPRWYKTSELFLRHMPRGSLHLDIGAGCGYLLFLAKHMLGTVGVGIDTPGNDCGRQIAHRLGVVILSQHVTPDFIPPRRYDCITLEHMSLHIADRWTPQQTETFIDNIAAHSGVVLISGNRLRQHVERFPNVKLLRGT